MLKEKFYFSKADAIEFIVDLGQGNGQDYAMAWLKLCNNARENPDIIYSLKNNYMNDRVNVVVNPYYADQMRDWLNELYWAENGNKPIKIGKVISERKVRVGIPYYAYDTDTTDDEQSESDFDETPDYWASITEEIGI